jgi:hypothetical protein
MHNPKSLGTMPVGYRQAACDFGWACHDAREVKPFASLPGEVFGGTYAEAASWMAKQNPIARAFILIFTAGTGMEKFLHELPAPTASIPIVGGAAARSGNAKGSIVPFAEDVAVFAISEGSWQAITVNAHFGSEEFFVCEGSAPRRFSHIRQGNETLPALDFFQRARKSHLLPANDWDRLALMTRDGAVLHLHPEDGEVVCGTDLPGSREVRLVVFDSGLGIETLRASINPQSLLFGCAGLHGLFENNRPWEQWAPTTYLFGEIANLNNRPCFSNLTFSVLQRIS